MKRFVALVLTLILVLGIACAAHAEGEKKGTIAVVCYVTSAPYFSFGESAAKATGEALGYDVIWTGTTEVDTPGLISIIENLIEQKVDALELNAKQQKDFVASFSHELKTPIVSISGLIALMKSEELDEEEKKKYLSVMEEEANRLTAMTSNALYLSKLETQGILTNLKKYNVSEQIRSCVLLLERKWEKKELIPSLDFDEYELYANEDMIKEVWLNLIDNAIKFADKGSEFEIAIKEVDEHLHISVSNYGPEIPKSEYKAIFGKFYQVEKSRSTEGNGIGLSIVKHILKLHKADITVESENGKTTFTVIIKKDGSLQN